MHRVAFVFHEHVANLFLAVAVADFEVGTRGEHAFVRPPLRVGAEAGGISRGLAAVVAGDEFVHGTVVGDPVPLAGLGLESVPRVGLVALDLEASVAVFRRRRARDLVLAPGTWRRDLVLDGAVGNFKLEIRVNLAAGLGELHLRLGVDLPAPLLGAVVRDHLHALHLVRAVAGGDDVVVEHHAAENSTLERIAGGLSLAGAEVVAPRGVRHDDVDAERGEELEHEDDDLRAALLDRLLLLADRLQRRRGGPVVVAVEILDTARGADERPEERGDPDGEGVVGDGLVGLGKVRRDLRLEERLEDRGETDDTEADVEEHASRFAQGVLVHEDEHTARDHHEGHPRPLKDGREDVGVRRGVERVQLEREAEQVVSRVVIQPSGPRVEPVHEILAVLPLGQVRHRRLPRVFRVVGRAHEVERQAEPDERAHADASHHRGSAPLAAIGVHRLCVARVQKGVALDERLRRPLLRGGMRGLVTAVVGEAAVVVHRRKALSDLGGVFAARVEPLELLDPLLRLAGLGAADAATLGADVGVGRVEGGGIDGGAHGRAVGALGALRLSAPVLLEVPAVLVVVVAILRVAAGAADHDGQLLGEVAQHADAKREHGDGDYDETDARLASGGDHLLVADDDHLDGLALLLVALLLVVEEHVLRLLAHHREHLGRVCGMYPVRDFRQGPFRGLACGAASPAW